MVFNRGPNQVVRENDLGQVLRRENVDGQTPPLELNLVGAGRGKGVSMFIASRPHPPLPRP